MALFNISLIFLLTLGLEQIVGGLSQTVNPNYNKVSDTELKFLSENLLSRETANSGGSVRLYLQNRPTPNQVATGPLLEYQVHNAAQEPQTYKLLKNLFREYENHNSRNLNSTINAFLNGILSTQIIQETISFINSHEVTMNRAMMKNYLEEIWFTRYYRGQNPTSGFQHVFMAELKHNNQQNIKEVLGLHNWLFYHKEQGRGAIRYHGWTRSSPFRGHSGSAVKVKFEWNQGIKHSGSMLVGTSPELEIALYTVCFIYRVSSDCKLKLGDVNVIIKTYPWHIRGTNTNVIATAYPVV